MKKLFISFIALSMAIGSFPLQSVRAAGSKLNISAKQVSGYGASSNPLANIVDGKKDTYWKSMSQNGEGNSDAEKKKSRMYDHNRYIDIKLNGTYDLDEIVIYNKEGSYNNYYIYASLDGEKYDKIVSKTNNFIATKEGDKHSLKGVKASYLRLNMAYNSDSYETNLAEIEVFGEKLSDDVKAKPKIKISDWEGSKWQKEWDKFETDQTYANQKTISEVSNLAGRVLGEEWKDRFVFEIRDDRGGNDVFEIEDGDNSIIIRGNDGVSLASGFNYYLKNFAMVDYNPLYDSNTEMKLGLVPVKNKIVKETQYDVRYALNFCTYSYTMAFWSWDEYQEFIDWAAMNGINLMLDIVGQEEVIRQTLLEYGFTNEEIKDYIAGPGYFAWFYMQNLYSFGGPLPDDWFEQRVELGRKMHDRMQAFGIDPVIQGFCGQVPMSFVEKNEGAVLTPIDEWPSFTRPAMIKTYLSQEEIAAGKKDYFKDVAKTFYEKQKNVFGDVSDYYASDPFHEGGNTQGLDVTNIFKTVQEEMLKSNADAIWVMQQWQGNLDHAKLSGLVKPEQALALDLQSDMNPSSVMENEGIPWIWCMLHNFGGRMGLDGEVEVIAKEPAIAASNNQYMKGIGITPEALENSPIVYEMLFDMTWSKDPIDYQAWVDKYATRRAGGSSDSLQEAWDMLLETAYKDKGIYYQGAGETVINARPGTNFSSASTWGHSNILYDKEELDKVLSLLIENYDAFAASEAYRYDLADVAEQVLCNAAIEYHALMVQALNNKDSAEFKRISTHFLELIDLSDRILGSSEEFMLGTWIHDAREMLDNADDWTKDLFEFNARALVTTWGGERSGSLKDYSNRKWAGLTSSFYKERWKMWISNRQAELDNTAKDPVAQKAESNWFLWEWQWVNRKSDDGFSFPTKADYSSLKELATTALEQYSTTSIKDFGGGEVEEKVNIAEGKLFTTTPQTTEETRRLLTNNNAGDLWYGEGQQEYQLVLDLEGVYEINSLEIYLENLAQNFQYNYKVEFLDSKTNEWVEIAHNTENDTMTTQTILEVEEGKKVSASQVRITMNTRSSSSEQRLRIAEIKIFGKALETTTYYNVAKGLVAECDKPSETNISLLTDDNTATLWKTVWKASKEEMYPATVTLDLAYSYDDAKYVEVSFEKAGLPFKFTVSVIDSTGKETVILDKTDHTSVLEDAVYKIDIPETITDVRKVKVHFADSTGQGAAYAASPAMSELKVMALSSQKKEEVKNVALQKPVSASSTNTAGGFKAEYVTDGNVDTAWCYDGNKETNSGNVEVDLQGVYDIKNIDLTFKKENYTKYYIFDVYVIDELDQKTIVYSENKENKHTYSIPVNKKIKKLGVSYKGKSQESNGWFDVAELEAFTIVEPSDAEVIFGEGILDGVSAAQAYAATLDNNLDTFAKVTDEEIVYDLHGNYYVESVDFTFEKAELGLKYMVYAENAKGERTTVLDRSNTNALLENRSVNVKVNRDATKIIFKHLGNNGQGPASLAEKRLYEVDVHLGKPKNVALNAQITAGAENMLDADVNTAHEMKANEAVEITLAKPVDINMLQVLLSNEGAYKIEVRSADDQQWTTVYDGAGKADNLFLLDQVVFADMLRLTAKSDISVKEFSIYELDATPALVSYIEEVRELLASKKYDGSNGSYSVEAKQAVEATLAEADAAIQAGLSSNDVEAWKTKISKAVKDFEKNGVIYIHRDGLLNAISEAEITIASLKKAGMHEAAEVLEKVYTQALEVYRKYDATQAQIDAAQKALNDAIAAAPEISTVNKTALKKAIKEAKAIQADRYTTSSYKVLKKALEEAVACEGSDKATQEQVNSATKSLQAALDGLKLRADAADAKALVDEIKALGYISSDYTVQSWKAFNAALTKVEAVIKDSSDVNAEQLKVMLENLSDAQAALVDIHELKALVKEVKEFVKNMTTSSAKNMNVLLKEAQALYEAGSKEAVAQMLTAIKAEKANLVPRGNVEALKAKLEEYKSLKESDYTAETWSVYEKALLAAQAIVKDNSDVSQEAVDTALNTLVQAKEALQKVIVEIPVDKSMLENLISEASNKHAKDYTEESWKVFEKALQTAKSVLADETAGNSDVEAAYQNLKEAMQALKKAANAGVGTGDTTNMAFSLTLLCLAGVAILLMTRKRLR